MSIGDTVRTAGRTRIRVTAAAMILAMFAAPGARAAGLALEANGARAQGHWGGELGAGYAFGSLGLSVRPMVGAFVHSDDVKPYGRIEATYEIPLVAEIGLGVRLSSDKARPYGTFSTPLLPLLRLKGNVGPKYYALGLSFGF